MCVCVRACMCVRVHVPVYVCVSLSLTHSHTPQYDVIAHWVWARNGWLRALGVLDFAGGLVIHVAAGCAGLVAGAFLGHKSEIESECVTACMRACV
jgi:ammonia channel protein AmtB